MRINIVILLITLTCLHVSAKVNAQKITITAKDAAIEQVFEQIEQKSGYDFFYDARQIKAAKLVTLNLKNAELKTILDACFKDQPFSYSIQNKTIVVTTISVDSERKSSNQASPASPTTIKGKVTDINNTPLIGVSVRLKETNIGTITDQNGSYSIEGDSEGIIVFSYIGFQTFEIRINGQTEINMTMVANTSQLEEQVIKGYYTTTRELNTGNVSTVKADVIERQPVSDPVAALISRVPGLFVQQTSGVSGRQFNIQLRGRNSIDNGNSPLFIVDNIQFESNPFNVNKVQFPAGGMASPFNYLNPADIESITVLKDADATAIYGSRGANGVILITTKKSKAERTQIDFNFYSGFSRVDQRVKFMNTREYLNMRREAFKNDGASPGMFDYDLNGTWDTTRYTDWQDLIIGGTAPLTESSISFSGGNALTQFRIGATYRTEGTVYPGNFNAAKIGTNFNINHTSANQRFTAVFSGIYTSLKNNLPYSGISQGIDRAVTLAPNAPAVYNDDGSLNWANSTFSNPIAAFKATSDENGKTVIGSLTLEYKILGALLLKGNFSYTQSDYNQRNLAPLSAQNPAFFPVNTHQFLNSKRQSWNIEPQVSYGFKTGELNLDFLIGSTIQASQSSAVGMQGSMYASDAIMSNFGAASLFTPLISSATKYKYGAVYSRVGLNYADRYVLNMTARRDGSSRFGSSRKFGNFGAIGAAWIASNESFMKGLKWLSLAKLRGSIGTTGNDQLGDYKFLDTYSSIAGTYQGISSLVPTQLTNPNYGWERINKIEIALEIGFLDNKISFTTSAYRNRTKNQLVQYALPNVAGFASVRQNLPATIQNSGLEFEISSINIEKPAFSWSTSANLTIPRNKLMSYPNLEASSYATRLRVGEPLSLFFGYNYLGVDPNNGLYLIEDRNDDGRFNSAFDYVAVFVGQKFYGGISNHLEYKQRLSLDFTFQYTKQNGFNYYINSIPGFFNDAQSNEIVQTNKIFHIAPYSQSKFDNFSSVNNFKSSNGIIDDASFLRLKNISVAWSIPISAKVQKVLKVLSVYLQGQNLITFSNYSGFDPEVPSASPTLPPLRTITAGLRATL